MQHHATQAHAELMQNAVNEMERVLVTVYLASKEIHTIKIVAVIGNVKSMMIVTIVWHASHTNVSIHVLAFVVIWLYAMYQGTLLPAPVHQDSPVIHSSNAVKFCEPLNNSIHAPHRRAVHQAIAVTMLAKRYALAHQEILERHQTVDLNVWFHLNVHQTELVSTTNVLIPVQIPVASRRFAMSKITIQFVFAIMATLATHSCNAQEFVSPFYFQMYFLV